MRNEAEIVELSRVFLRKNDFLGGYFPQLLLDQKESEIWSLFWFCVRKLDDIFDQNEYKLDHTQGKTDLGGFLKSLNETRPELTTVISTFRNKSKGLFKDEILFKMLSSAMSEKKSFHRDQTNSFKDYFQLIDSKTKLPLQIYATLGQSSLDDPYFDLFITWLARSIQLYDDLLDFFSDLKEKKNYITHEEMQFLSCNNPNDLLLNLDEVISLRLSVFLHYSIETYKLSCLFWDKPIGWFGRSILESSWAMISDGRSSPLPSGLLNNDFYLRHYVGLTSLPMDLINTSEKNKYLLFNPIIKYYIQSYKLFHFDQVEKMKSDRLQKGYDSFLKSLPKLETPSQLNANIQDKLSRDHRKLYSPNRTYGLNLFNLIELGNIGLNYFKNNQSEKRVRNTLRGRTLNKRKIII